LKSDWYERLNPEQCEAVAHNEGPLLILAGAGSGKTTVLVARTGRMIAEGVVQPSQMVVLTFTNKAARELKNRVAARLGELGNGLWAGTFHSFGLSMLRKYHKLARLPRSFGVMDTSDSQAVVKELLKNLNVSSKTAFDTSRLLSIMSRWRESGQTRAQNDDEYEAAVEVLMPKYLRRLNTLGVVDFDGLLQKPIQILQDHEEIRLEFQEKTRQLMVDEFQDTNDARWSLFVYWSKNTVT
jgi:DNA helicase-2/ATP-dependent DNA helicase PcrA